MNSFSLSLLIMFVAFAESTKKDLSCELAQLHRTEQWFMKEFEQRINRANMVVLDNEPNEKAMIAHLNDLFATAAQRVNHKTALKNLQTACAQRGARFDRKTRECF